MAVEGRIAIGLDEFMLRLGHVTALVDIVEDLSGSRNRAVRAFAEWLTEPLPVPEWMIESVGTYLVKKKLAGVTRGQVVIEPQRRARYPEIVVSLLEDGQVGAVVPPKGELLEIWREDLLIAEPSVRSKVGAVTVETRDTSHKSGVSHLIDWALALDVLDTNLNAGSIGQVLQLLWKKEKDLGRVNPYIVQGQRLAYIWILFQADGDVLSQLLTSLPVDKSLTKATALEVFERVFERLYDDAFGSAATASPSATRRVREFRDDLGIAGGLSTANRRPSTMWHRLSSRLESLVDVGLLEKTDDSGSERPYEYIYRLTVKGRQAAASLRTAATVDDWLLDSSVSVIEVDGGSESRGLPNTQHLFDAVDMLRGPTGIHIDSCALLASSLAALRGESISIRHFRNVIIATATERPAIARLARGHSGDRPEFVTFDFRLLEQHSHDSFVQGQLPS